MSDTDQALRVEIALQLPPGWSLQAVALHTDELHVRVIPAHRGNFINIPLILVADSVAWRYLGLSYGNGWVTYRRGHADQ